jgi:putative aldouronate transport system permease protein
MVKAIRMKDPIQDKILYWIVGVVFTFVMIMVLYPLVFVVSASLSSGAALDSGRVVLWPVDPTLQGYKFVFSHRNVLSSYRNTIFYTVVGTLLNVAITLIAAYPLSRKDFPARKYYMIIGTVTMFFSGGLVPTYILIVKLGMINKVWSMLIPGALNVYNMILVRTFIMSSIPDELLEAAQIDGYDDTRYFFTIVLPLSKPVIAVITLYYAVSHWNSYFNAMLYLSNEKLYPLQLVLRDILIAANFSLSDIQDADLAATMTGLANLLKYSLIVVSSVPIIAMYPFVQRYFIKGVMIGSIKG